MTHQIEAVCFDLDDTLYDYHRYARAGHAAAADLLASRTGDEYHEELLDIHFDDERTEGAFDILVERHDLPSGIVDDLVEAYHNATEPLMPYPETESVLSQLGEQYQLGLITDGRGGHGKLDRLGIREQFDTVLVTPTIRRSKHDPVVFKRVLAELSTDPEMAVYVGDDPRVDFTVPNDMGMTTVRQRRGRYTDLEPTTDDAAPDREIRYLDELPRLLSAVDAADGAVDQRGKQDAR